MRCRQPHNGAGNPLPRSRIAPFPQVRSKRGNWSFATAKAFVIRRPARERLFRLFPDSSAVEHSTVNRMVAGSNPAPGAKLINVFNNLEDKIAQNRIAQDR